MISASTPIEIRAFQENTKKEEYSIKFHQNDHLSSEIQNRKNIEVGFGSLKLVNTIN